MHRPSSNETRARRLVVATARLEDLRRRQEVTSRRMVLAESLDVRLSVR